MPFANPFRRKKDRPSEASQSPAKSATSNGKNVNDAVEAKTLVFNTQLAHGSATGKIQGFTNIQELYDKISNIFSIPIAEILFCTLNTHKCDMERLLGGKIGLEDFIFVHVKGEKKLVTLTKSENSLGLTITDNGSRYAFIKRLKVASTAEKNKQIAVGDHIEAIDDQSTVGCRHFQVAQRLKSIPIGTTFTLTLVEPRKAFDKISQRGATKVPVSNNVGTGKETLRLRSKGPATLEALPTEGETKAVAQIDDLLDSFLGIRDMELSSTIWESGKNKRNPDDFITALTEQLGDFGFPQEFIFDVWGVILDARKSNTF